MAAVNKWKSEGIQLVGFFGTQLVVQILTLITGLLIVRRMSKPEYAFYVMANTFQGAINVLSDSGIGSALSATGGVVWQDRSRFGELIQTALGFRRRFGLIASIIIGPILWWMLLSKGSGANYGILICVIVLSGVSLAMTHSVFVVVPRLHGRIIQMQKADLGLALLRLFLIGITSFLFFDAAIALLISVATLAVQNAVYKNWANVDADLSSQQNEEDKKNIKNMVLQQAPNSIFYCVQGQLVIFLISLFGKTNQIADVGAVGRLTVFFTVIGSVLTNVVLPRFARCQDGIRIKFMYAQVVSTFLAISVVIMVVSFLYPETFLWFLGPKYMHLKHELSYMVFASIVNGIAGMLYSLNASRGWLKGGWMTIPITVIIQILLLSILDLRTVKGVVLFSSLPVIPAVIPYVYRAYQSMQEICLSQAKVKFIEKIR